MLEVVLDTETTGLDPAAGHRIVEVAGIELFNHVPTGRNYQSYVNPERDVPEDAYQVHGLGTTFLAGHRVFAEVVDELLAFLGEARLVIHNAEFDLRFLNAELARLGRPPLANERAICTLNLARQRFPGAQANLDALCRRFAIDNAARSLHGALLDCQLLAEVYLELCGGRQPDLGLGQATSAVTAAMAPARAPRPPRAHAASAAEMAAHAAMVAKLHEPIWLA